MATKSEHPLLDKNTKRPLCMTKPEINTYSNILFYLFLMSQFSSETVIFQFRFQSTLQKALPVKGLPMVRIHRDVHLIAAVYLFSILHPCNLRLAQSFKGTAQTGHVTLSYRDVRGVFGEPQT